MNEQLMESIADEVKELLKEKNKSYGDGNITSIGKQGILIRLQEKVERLKNMIEKDIDDKESREDSWKDIIGYGIIGTMVERGGWE
jgi:C4-type Zn-finger protein